jgi:hypothetical protein
MQGALPLRGSERGERRKERGDQTRASSRLLSPLCGSPLYERASAVTTSCIAARGSGAAVTVRPMTM